MPHGEHASARSGARSGLWFLVLLLAAFAGCSTRNDPAYNPYCPLDGDPGLMGRMDQLNQAADEALDNLDERLENILY